MLRPVFESEPPRLAAEAVPAPNRTVDLREMIRILRRRRWIVLGAVGACVALAALYVAAAPQLYTATATILIDPHRSHVADSDDRPQPSNFGTDDAMIESQVLLMQSVAVLQRVVDQLKLAKDSEFAPHPGLLDPLRRMFGGGAATPAGDPQQAAKSRTVEALARRLKVSREGTTFVIDIAASSARPDQAEKIANAVADSYFYEQVHSRRNTNRIAAEWLGEQLDELRTRVQTSEKTLEEFRVAHNLVTTQGLTVNDQQLTDLNNKLTDAHVQTAEARARYQRVENITNTHSDPGTLDQALSSNVIKELRKQYADVAKNVADLSSKFGPQHPQVVTARAQLRETQRLIDQEVKRILASTRQAYKVAQSREQALQKSLDDLQSTSTDLSKARVRLRELAREADANRTLYESFLARYKTTTAQESLELPDSRVVSRAEVPIRASFPKTKLILALAALLGGGIGVVLAFAVDFMDRRVKSLRQAEDITHLPSLAAIPLVGTRELARRAHRGRKALDQYDPTMAAMLPSAMQPPLVRYALDEPTSLFAEAVRAVRLAVQRPAQDLAGQDLAGRTVMVCSSVDGEGKTTLAVNLALSLAAVGMRTILVDGDLRNPELTRSLCPHAKAGLLEAAAGYVPLEQVVLMDKSTGLAVLPTPPRRKGGFVNEFVFSEAMSNLLDYLRAHFDYVVVDSPPLVPLVDGRALAEQADRIVLTIRWDATPQEVVTQAIESLGPVSDRLVGTVLARVDMRQLRFYDYYRSSSYLQPYSYLGQPHAEPAP
jgi:exopolysaccharide transport family protein